MEITNLIPHIEALVFASDKPLTSLDITELLNNAFGFMEDKISLDQVESSIEGITEKYSSEFYPFELRQSGGGWQFLTKKDYHKTIAQLNGDKFLKRLSSAALETLSIIAYKQPVTKGEIESIRGVSSDYAVQKLLEKELIIISGRNEKLPGHPLVYSTSKNFMDYFGINSAEDLPKIKEVLADQVVEPTIIKDAEISEEGNNEGTEDKASHYLTEEEIKAEGTEDETMLSVTEEEAKAERTEEETMLSGTEEEAKAEGVDNDAMLSVTEDGELVDKVEGEEE